MDVYAAGSAGKRHSGWSFALHNHEGARPFFRASVNVETIDIGSQEGATYTGDICRTNECFEDASLISPCASRC